MAEGVLRRGSTSTHGEAAQQRRRPRALTWLLLLLGVAVPPTLLLEYRALLQQFLVYPVVEDLGSCTLAFHGVSLRPNVAGQFWRVEVACKPPERKLAVNSSDLSKSCFHLVASTREPYTSHYAGQRRVVQASCSATDASV